MSKQWNYGDAGDRWPVRPGDVWRAGDHVLACGDLERGAGGELLDTYGEPDAVYSDPPWDAGNASSFRTKAGVPRKVDFESLMRAWIDVARRSRGDAYVEMGIKNAPVLRSLLEAAGGTVANEWSTTYYRKHPARLLRVAWGAAPRPVALALDGMDDDDTPRPCIEAATSRGQVVLDPCTGRGLTCRTAHALGRRFLGLELHPRRLAVTIDWLAEQGLKPERVGRLATMEGA